MGIKSDVIFIRQQQSLRKQPKEKDSATLNVFAIYERVYDELVSGEAVEWEVANPKIATVEEGKVTAHKKGKTTISVSYGGKASKITVTVR